MISKDPSHSVVLYHTINPTKEFLQKLKLEAVDPSPHTCPHTISTHSFLPSSVARQSRVIDLKKGRFVLGTFRSERMRALNRSRQNNHFCVIWRHDCGARRLRVHITARVTDEGRKVRSGYLPFRTKASTLPITRRRSSLHDVGTSSLDIIPPQIYLRFGLPFLHVPIGLSLKTFSVVRSSAILTT
ncbi:hypothetical protein TNCV_4292871 [Trichonephila clavipes]|uniref:Uncharacterized protein n=1 Tax=Trichonephila clavipes TaxID=2585209 RepID=A0A8X6RSC2_TRICX|nr:hypothetical protein TNCV_4292871 [Trichonephila clavipes]